VTAVRLGRVARLVTDRADKHEFRLGLEGIQGFTGRLRPGVTGDYDGDGLAFRPGDVLFGKLRPYLSKSWVADRQGAAVGDFHVYRPSPALTSRYLGYVLLGRSFLDPVTASVAGAKMPRTNWEFVRNVEIFLPPLAEQASIADYLDRETAHIDALIVKQEQLIATLRERRAAVISREFGAMPSDRVQLRRLIRVLTSGSRGWGDYYATTGDRFLRIGNLPRVNLMLRGEVQHVALPTLTTEGERTRLRKNDLLFSITAYLGSVAVVDEEWIGAYVSQHVALCRLDSAHANSAFIGWFMLSREGQEQLKLGAAGGTKQQLALPDIRELQVPLPPLSEQRRIVSHLSERTATTDALIGKAERFIELSKERRAALITAAVTGQIDIRTAGVATNAGEGA